MVRPKDIPTTVWAETDAIGEKVFGRHERGWVMWPLVIPTQEAVARAIMAERERCATIADAYAEVNWEQCTDSILLDPVLSNKGECALTKADWAKAEDMAVEGKIHSSMYHAATNIAAAIRGEEP